MNCNDISRILDEQRMSDLSAAGMDEVEAHVAGCAACADQVLASERVASLRPEVPPLPAALAERVRNLQEPAESNAVPGHTRRPVIIGSLFLLGAAATMYAAVPWRDTGAARQ